MSYPKCETFPLRISSTTLADMYAVNLVYVGKYLEKNFRVDGIQTFAGLSTPKKSFWEMSCPLGKVRFKQGFGVGVVSALVDAHAAGLVA